VILPPVINIEVTCETHADLSGLIVELNMPVGRKNPYHIFSPKTDSTGRASITAEDFRGQFEDHWEQGLMDYDGSIESASGHVRVELFDPKRMRENLRFCIAWPLLKNERRTWASRGEQVEYFLSCRNESFELARTPHLVKVPDDGKLVLEVRHRE
jgi:hypothetical protein